MNITFTDEELAKFAGDMAKWYDCKMLFICENFMRRTPDLRFERQPERMLGSLAEEFDKANPKPDWRSFL